MYFLHTILVVTLRCFFRKDNYNNNHLSRNAKEIILKYDFYGLSVISQFNVNSRANTIKYCAKNMVADDP